MKTFALTGAAGFVAERHFQAIKNTGNKLVAVLDPHDSVGKIDKYFPGARYFSQPERFDRFIYKQNQKGAPVDYLSICSPNYMHDPHIRLGLRNNMEVLCEKPLVVNPRNLKDLKKLEKTSNRKINVVLQLRHHSEIIKLKELVDREFDEEKYTVKLTYHTPRGAWYKFSWKGDERKSGGLAANIGIHFFDMLLWIFGDVERVFVSENNEDVVSGTLELEKANVSFRLSIEQGDFCRQLTINGQEINFTEGFTDLHEVCYINMLCRQGFGIEDTEKSLWLVDSIRRGA
jgi:UDP-N-acetyl-2-amino-2-deoxyglucuronate dehydrogenase